MTDEAHTQLGSINVYKPSGKGTLLSDLIKDKEDTPQIKKQQSKPQTRLQERKQEQEREQERDQSENIEDSYDDIIDRSKFRRQLIRRPKLHKIKKQEKPKPQKIIDYVLFVFEIIIILSLYVVMSQPFVISFLSKYINQLNPNENGEASMAGIVIYGFILAVLFLIVRKIVFSRL